MQTLLGSGVAVAVVEAGSYSSDCTPRLGTSICPGRCPKKTNKQTKTKLLLFSLGTRSWVSPTSFGFKEQTLTRKSAEEEEPACGSALGSCQSQEPVCITPRLYRQALLSPGTLASAHRRLPLSKTWFLLLIPQKTSWPCSAASSLTTRSISVAPETMPSGGNWRGGAASPPASDWLPGVR